MAKRSNLFLMKAIDYYDDGDARINVFVIVCLKKSEKKEKKEEEKNQIETSIEKGFYGSNCAEE